MKLLKRWFDGVCETFLGKHGYMVVVTVIGAYIGLYSIMEARFERAMSRATFERQAFMQMVSSGSFVVAMKTFGPVQNVVVPQEPTLWAFWAWFKKEKPNMEPLHRWAVHFFPLCREMKDCRGGESGLLLERADLRAVDLHGAHLGGANLSGAYLHGANLIRATGLTKEQIESAYIDENTRLPDYLKGSTEGKAGEGRK